MALITAGSFPDAAFPSRGWMDNLWPEYGVSGIASSLLEAGYWHTTYWVKGYWMQDYWPEYGAVAPAPPSVEGDVWAARRKRIPSSFMRLLRQYLEDKSQSYN